MPPSWVVNAQRDMSCVKQHENSDSPAVLYRSSSQSGYNLPTWLRNVSNISTPKHLQSLWQLLFGCSSAVFVEASGVVAMVSHLVCD